MASVDDMYALTNCQIHTAAAILDDHALLIDEGRIRAIAPTAQLTTDCWQIDLQGWNVCPGFIDLQLNGCGGVMFNDAIAPRTLDTMHQTNLRSGTTSFLPTLITTSDADMTAAMSVVRDYRRIHPHSVLGLHLEGPYLNPKRKGIHNGKFVRSPDEPMIEAIAAARTRFYEAGLDWRQISGGAYNAAGRASAPVIFSFTRYRAVAPDCPAGWDSMRNDRMGESDERFGCATAANLAAMVADPRDLTTPRTFAEPDTMRRQRVLERYRAGEPTGSRRNAGESGAVSDAVNN